MSEESLTDPAAILVPPAFLFSALPPEARVRIATPQDDGRWAARAATRRAATRATSSASR
jgi:hypothetical protein